MMLTAFSSPKPQHHQPQAHHHTHPLLTAYREKGSKQSSHPLSSTTLVTIIMSPGLCPCSGLRGTLELSFQPPQVVMVPAAQTFHWTELCRLSPWQ